MKKILAVDFDGTIVENDWPLMGKPIADAIETLLELQSMGYALMLWTCREDSLLAVAVEYCENNGLVFDSVNENMVFDSRKPFANYYIDDRNIGGMPDWKTIKELLTPAEYLVE